MQKFIASVVIIYSNLKGQNYDFVILILLFKHFNDDISYEENDYLTLVVSGQASPFLKNFKNVFFLGEIEYKDVKNFNSLSIYLNF